MAIDDDVDAALAMDEPTIAERLLDDALRDAKKRKHAKEIAAIVRRRAVLAEESSIDDDLPSLADATKRIREATLVFGASADDHARHGWALLMQGAPGKARTAAPDDALVRAGNAWARAPSAEKRAAMVEAAGPQLERVVRLLLQRDAPALDLARSLYDGRQKKAKLPARDTLRALRLLVAAAHAEGAPDAAALAALDPQHGEAGTSLRGRLERLAAVEKRFGGGALLFQPLVALAHAAGEAGEHDVAVEACERIDAILSPKKSSAGRDDRRYYLGWLRDAYVGLGRWDDAIGALVRAEAILALQGFPSPDHGARAAIAEARGDWDAVVDECRKQVALYASWKSEGGAWGPTGSNTQLARGWLARAEAQRAKAAPPRKPKR